MKVKLTPVLLFLLFLASHCAPESAVFHTVKLRFAIDDPSGRSNGRSVEVEARVIKIGSKWILRGDGLLEVETIDEARRLTYGYVYAEAPEGDSATALYGIYRGYYGFDGNCFVYGTLIEGDNGVSIFVPADTTTRLMGFGDVCPGEDEAFA